MPNSHIVVIGSGIIGIATAYYLAKNHGQTQITLVDRGQPMAFTSAQSGENYRNWWPHPAMVALTNRSIDLMEEIARDTGNRINMNRRGYALSTRDANIDHLVQQLHDGLGESAGALLRFHTGANGRHYAPFDRPDWEGAPDGVDIVQNQDLIRDRFPTYDPAVRTIIHIRRGGDISGQQLGMHMLDFLKETGAKRVTGDVQGITQADGYRIDLALEDGTTSLQADQIVNAAGPFADRIAAMLDVDLPVFHTFQQKIAFEDRMSAVPRTLPFSIDLDKQLIDWTQDELDILRDDPEHTWLTQTMPGAIHCRPDGGDNGKWVKLGWAYNQTPADATWEPPLYENFPDIVLRGAARLSPTLKAYYGQLPRAMHHYGGWYTMTEENWPLIGSMGPDGVFMNCAHSGFGTMAACAAGELCAATIADSATAEYARVFSMDRLRDEALMKHLGAANKGIL